MTKDELVLPYKLEQHLMESMQKWLQGAEMGMYRLQSRTSVKNRGRKYIYKIWDVLLETIENTIFPIDIYFEDEKVDTMEAQHFDKMEI